MSYEYKDLMKKTLKDLKAIARKEGIKGFSMLRKEALAKKISQSSKKPKSQQIKGVKKRKDDYGEFLNKLTREELIKWDKEIKKPTKELLDEAKKYFESFSPNKILTKNALSFLESEITTDYIYNPKAILNKSKKGRAKFYKEFFDMYYDVSSN